LRAAQLALTKKAVKDSGSLRFLIWLGAGLILMLVLSSLAAWQSFDYWGKSSTWPLLGLSILAYLISFGIFSQLQSLPRAQTVGLIFLIFSVGFILVLAILAFGRLYYSRSFLLSSCILSILWLFLGYRYGFKTRNLRLAVVPGGMANELMKIPGVDWVLLKNPEFSRELEIDGLTVDLHQKLTTAWVRFLSDCSLKRISVYHAAVVFEAATGRTSLSHLSEGLLEDFEKAPFYVTFKRIVDLTLILISAPVILILALLISVAIRIDSPGPAIFRQKRIGQGGIPFQLLKFRSMLLDAEKHGAKFASNYDLRVTRVGRFLRKSRLDELPQIWNILRGEMSLIGPRPEQVPFSKQFETEIPFYGYRHLVKPGITGWAQVNHGYASGTEETQDKLEFDLYYIKYFSFWLDVLILFKTVRTIFMGDGAR
jgi:lipopolysaccharide/colanic/teichoic acid biosynthesis glycosyltransferase